jgi:outer membrane protein OmpU
MKKILLSTTMLALFAGAASAEVTLSGSGRFGLLYSDNVADGESKTRLHTRLRINVDAKFEADNGVTYGGRIRFQGVDGNEAAFSPAMLYVEASGVRVEVGNVNTAFDSVALMYNPEIGFTESSFGDPLGSFYSFSSGAYNGEFDTDRTGIYAAYSINGFNLKASIVQPDQGITDTFFDEADETSIAVDYQAAQFTIAAAYVANGKGVEGNDQTFVGAAYKISDVANVGLNYNDNGQEYTPNADLNLPGTFADVGTSVTLYGNYTVNGITLAGYVTDLSDSETIADADVAYGLGASYDLGGATLAGAVHSDFEGDISADLGVRMSF